MIGKRAPLQEVLFVAGSMRSFIPDDHILVQVDRVLDLSWLEDEVRGCYCEENGRPSIAPEAALRLMLAGLFQGITQDRKLMREAQVNLAIRWFAGYALDEKLPDHSSLTRIRQRWGAERFRRIFRRTVEQCVAHGLVSGETLHVDATLIRADVSWRSLTRAHVERVIEENGEEEGDDGPQSRDGRGSVRRKKWSRTDPDATMTTGSHGERLEPRYKQHTAVDDASGVVVDAEVTTGETSESRQLVEQVGRAEFVTGQPVEMVTADAGYGHGRNYEALEARGTEAVVKPQRSSEKSRGVPLSRFRYDPRHRRVRCPGGRVLLPVRTTEKGTWYCASSRDCRSCPLRARCVPRTATRRTVLIVHGYDALLRARRRRGQWDERWRRAWERHWWMIEGIHGEAKAQHGLARAARRGLGNVRIQAYLTAAVINLKRLVKHVAAPHPHGVGGLQSVVDGSSASAILHRLCPLRLAHTLRMLLACAVAQSRLAFSLDAR